MPDDQPQQPIESMPAMNGHNAVGHLYTQTNELRNSLIHYRRSANGAIEEVDRVSTGGAGSGEFKPTSGQESAPNAFEGRPASSSLRTVGSCSPPAAATTPSRASRLVRTAD